MESDAVQVSVGLRVVRGPDWEWGDQDGGEGHVGTVADVEEMKGGGRAAIVQWDCGQRCRYRCGVQGKYDLRVIDSAPTGLIFPGVRCFACRRDEIKGFQWTCSQCHEYQLCTLCYMAGKHLLEHVFYCILNKKENRIKLSFRKGQRKLPLKGLFPEAKVKRGHDWKWKNQDGGLGSIGILINVTDWKTETTRSVAEVKWDKSATKNVYRIGHKGKVDLMCIVPGDGGFYYPDNLPVLGAPITPINSNDFISGDRVKTNVDMDALLALGQAGINEQVLMMLDHVGEVVSILENGDLCVRYPNNSLHTVSPDSATKVDKPSTFAVGDVVRLVDDIGKVFSLQSGHGEWVDTMALALGQLGVVKKILPDGDVRVSICRHHWIMNPECLIPAPGEVPPIIDHVVGSGGLNLEIQFRLMSLPSELLAEVVVQAAGAGDIDTIRTFLHTSPDKVNISHDGKTLLMVAVEEGHADIVKLLLEFNANADIMHKSGEKLIHVCAFLDSVDCAKLLLEAGVDVNSMNGKDNTPLMVAAAIGHHNILKLFAYYPSINLNQQDFTGRTALHHCIGTRQLLSIAILLDAGADPTMLDCSFSTPIHDAAQRGFLGAMEEFMSVYPQHTNIKKPEDEQTPLHMAALANRHDVVKFLCQISTCDINAKNHKQHTPLHCAVINGQSRVVETLVGHGADPNAADGRGNMALHIVFIKRNAKAPSNQDTPELTRVQKELQRITKAPAVANYMTLACFLAQEGANITVQNRDGQTIARLCPSEMSVPLMNFVNSSRRGCFHGSLNAPDDGGDHQDQAQPPQAEAQERIIVREESPARPPPSTRTEPSTFKNELTQKPQLAQYSEVDSSPRGVSSHSKQRSSVVETHSSSRQQVVSHSSSSLGHDTQVTSESLLVTQQVGKSTSQVSKLPVQVSKSPVTKSPIHVSKPSGQVTKSPSKVSKSPSKVSTPPSKVSKSPSEVSTPVTHSKSSENSPRQVGKTPPSQSPPSQSPISQLQTPVEEKCVDNISVQDEKKAPDSVHPLTVHTPSSMVSTLSTPASNGRITAIGNKDGSKLKPQSQSSVEERTAHYMFSDLQVKDQRIVKVSDKEKQKSPPRVEPASDVSRESSPKDGANAAGCEAPCFLCEEPCNVKFEPCGHIVMCDQCAKRTTKCPLCRGAVCKIIRTHYVTQS